MLLYYGISSTMSCEKEILEEINVGITMFLKNLDMSQEYMYNVITKIVSLNNSYFVEDKEQIHSKIQEMFVSSNGKINELDCLLSNYKYIVEDKLNNICEHEWIIDLIDIDPDRSKIITYCKHCELSKK